MKLSRSWPNSLAARMSATLIAGVVIGQVISVWVVFRDSRFRPQEFQSEIYASRIVSLVQVLDGLDPDARQNLIRALPVPEVRLDIAEPSPSVEETITLGSRLAQQIETKLAQTLGASAAVDVSASRLLEEAAIWSLPLPHFEDPNRLPQEMERLVVVTRLGDGTWVEFSFLASLGVPMVPKPMVYSLVTLCLVLILACLFASYRVVRPLRELAEAADALGRDLRRAPLNEGGPTELARTAKAFNLMQDRLLRFINGRTDTLAAMSHDLRTPITRIRLRAELLPDAEREALADDVREMDQLIERTLGFMRGLGDGEPEATVSGSALVERCVAGFRDLGAEVGIGRLVEAWVHGRPDLLRRALNNLIDNAIHYGRDPQVNLICEGAEVVFQVADRGHGVPDNLIPSLVRPFYRVEASRNRRTGGTGLGLSIVKDIAERHGGRLVLANRVDGGFLAEIRLSVTRPPLA